MIHIQKSLSFILLNRAIYYHDRPLSIMRWLRKYVWIQRMLRPHALQYWEFKLSFERIESIQWSFNYRFCNEFYLLLPGPINSINGWISLLNHNSGRNVTILSMIFISETKDNEPILFGCIGHLYTAIGILRKIPKIINMYRDIKIKLYAFHFRQTSGGRREKRALIFIVQWAGRGRRNKQIIK